MNRRGVHCDTTRPAQPPRGARDEAEIRERFSGAKKRGRLMVWHRSSTSFALSFPGLPRLLEGSDDKHEYCDQKNQCQEREYIPGRPTDRQPRGFSQALGRPVL